MYKYLWDIETGGYLLDAKVSGVKKELRPVFHEELDLLGFNEYWKYPQTELPLLWAETRRYYYMGQLVAEANGGGLFTKPTLKIHKPSLQLEPVDVSLMIERNKSKMAALVQNTVETIYKTYNDYKSKVNIVYVAFSGGKDSLVLLDLVQKTLAHDSFKVVFSDTTMEISDTYKAVTKAKNRWPTMDFKVAKCHMNAKETWELFAPPAKIQRWCCAVHKTAPALLKLRELTGSAIIKALVFDGIRAEESSARSTYDTVTDGNKHTTQINCSPIINWGTSELFLYLFENNLLLNYAYRYGVTRVGCALCPMSSPWRDYITKLCYEADMTSYIAIVEKYARSIGIEQEQIKNFIESSGWRNRAGGRGLMNSNNLNIQSNGDTLTFTIKKEKTDWMEWIKTIGNLIFSNQNGTYLIEYNGIRYNLKYTKEQESFIEVSGLVNSHSDGRFIYCIKNIMGKASYCIGCKVCEVQCPVGALRISDSRVIITKDCIHCEKCLELRRGCLVAKSHYSTIGGKKVKSLKGMNRYSTFGMRAEWIKYLYEFGAKEYSRDLGPDQQDGFKKWLIDAEILEQQSLTKTGDILISHFAEPSKFWSVIAVNLTYNSIIFNWYIRNAEFMTAYTKNDLITMLGDDYPKRTRSNALNALINTFASSPIGRDLGIGVCEFKGKTITTITRTTWENPDPIVLLYALYKFAEKCDGHYGFTLSYLYNCNVKREGISPTQIFGLSADVMKEGLVALARDYNEYICVDFNKDLDNIDLRKEKSSIDILHLF